MSTTYKIIDAVQKVAMMVGLLAVGYIISNIMTATIAFAIVAGLGFGLACMLNFPIEEHLDALKAAALVIALPSLYFLAGNLIAPLVVLGSALSVVGLCNRFHPAPVTPGGNNAEPVPPPSAAPAANSHSGVENGLDMQALLAAVTPVLYSIYTGSTGMPLHTSDDVEFTSAGYPNLTRKTV